MVNLKKAALAVLALSVAGVASAAMYAPPPAAEAQETTAKHGFYVGVGVGALAAADSLSASGTATSSGILGGTAEGSANNDLGGISVNSYVLGGYSWVFPNKLFLGAEVFGSLTNASGSASASTVSASDSGFHSTGVANGGLTFTEEGGYGVRALPGYQVSPDAVVYAIAGWSNMTANIGVNGSATTTVADVDAADVAISGSSSDSYNFNGYQLGLGSMINVTSNIAVRGDLIWSSYGSKNVAGGAVTAEDTTAQGTVSVDPSSLEANVGVVYTFD